jgi:hypothetical protein
MAGWWRMPLVRHRYLSRAVHLATQFAAAINSRGRSFIPKRSWQGFENPCPALFLLWATAPTGQAEFSLAISSQPGEPHKYLTAEPGAAGHRVLSGGLGAWPADRARPASAGAAL